MENSTNISGDWTKKYPSEEWARIRVYGEEFNVALRRHVAKISIEPTPRPYADHRAYCLFFANGTCGKCIDRCPVRAITETGHDKEKCRQHLVRSRE